MPPSIPFFIPTAALAPSSATDTPILIGVPVALVLPLDPEDPLPDEVEAEPFATVVAVAADFVDDPHPVNPVSPTATTPAIPASRGSVPSPRAPRYGRPVRVVSGTVGGRSLQAPAGRATRPTSDRVREAMFSMLESRGGVAGASVIDLFAGSGALGIEALSRGAATVTFVDSAPAAIAAIRANLGGLGLAGEAATVIRGDATRFVRSAPPVDLVFADPPYRFAGWPGLLADLHGRVGTLVVETGGDWDPGPGWETVKVRRYGATVVTVVLPTARPPDRVPQEGEI
jgi:16S rRNA (guanine966-N2)-methyltransferase